MAEDIDRLVEQARELRPAATGEAAYQFLSEAPGLLAGLADAVEQLQRDGAEDRAMADRWIDLTQLLTELGMPQDDHTGETAATEDRVRWLADERDDACARVDALEDVVARVEKRLKYAGADRDGAYLHAQWRALNGALLDGRVPSTGQETT